MLTTAAAPPDDDGWCSLSLHAGGTIDEVFERLATFEPFDLPAETVEANMTYLRSMLSQQNAWNQLKDDDKKKPDTN